MDQYLLSDFILSAVPFPDIVSEDTFFDLLPKSYKSKYPTLYSDLCDLFQDRVDQISSNIAAQSLLDNTTTDVLPVELNHLDEALHQADAEQNRLSTTIEAQLETMQSFASYLSKLDIGDDPNIQEAIELLNSLQSKPSYAVPVSKPPPKRLKYKP
ncbi:hypothetical protein CANCADRAFT_507 [Tortispora caseinolytica NRRL Y-17796]|uniref:Uncharacterized protein n=1 Tax=Tortispora caseinolytica NRRL Y-17796 TaxID=767744 RepID=A0A1E4TJJ8_9ASCO|nr:hypothetical protein CANCADRAFT_507 [Tortispora caseinolytica NRRL Y-17796]